MRVFWFVYFLAALPWATAYGNIITVTTANGTVQTMNSIDYAVMKRSTLNHYRYLKQRVKELEDSGMGAKSLSCTECPKIEPRATSPTRIPDETKNKIWLYGGVNQGALTVTETGIKDGGKQLNVFQRTAFLGGLGYSRNVYGPLNVSVTFLYQGIYLSGVGFDF